MSLALITQQAAIDSGVPKAPKILRSLHHTLHTKNHRGQHDPSGNTKVHVMVTVQNPEWWTWIFQHPLEHGSDSTLCCGSHEPMDKPGVFPDDVEDMTVKHEAQKMKRKLSTILKFTSLRRDKSGMKVAGLSVEAYTFISFFFFSDIRSQLQFMSIGLEQPPHLPWASLTSAHHLPICLSPVLFLCQEDSHGPICW